MPTWVEDIRQALQNLGGEASLSEIYDEVKRVRVEPLPRTWKAVINGSIERHSSDSKTFSGKDFFYKAEVGVWGLLERPIFPKGAPSKLSRRKKGKKVKSHFVEQVSSEEVSMILSTLNDYRSYYHPKSENWGDYIDQVFYILGFNINKIDDYHQLIGKMGSKLSPSAVVFTPKISQDFDTAISNVEWEDLLFYAAQHFHVPYGIITNGLKLKIIDFQSNDPQIHAWLNFDDIVTNQYSHSFYELYFAMLKMKS
ncbi:MAG: hypothetical protein ACTSYF_12875 [Promethearchaeota archaeon]